MSALLAAHLISSFGTCGTIVASKSIVFTDPAPRQIDMALLNDLVTPLKLAFVGNEEARRFVRRYLDTWIADLPTANDDLRRVWGLSVEGDFEDLCSVSPAHGHFVSVRLLTDDPRLADTDSTTFNSQFLRHNSPILLPVTDIASPNPD